MPLSTFDAFKHVSSDDVVLVEGELLRRVQDELREMLADIVGLLEEGGIQYTLGGGTCLGAVRHHGFIPWDDDVDLNVARADIDRFVQLVLEKRRDRYWVHTPHDTKGSSLCIVRIRKKGTVLRTLDDFDIDECGLFIDVFIVENVPNNAVLRTLHGVGSLAIGLAYSCRRQARYWNEFQRLAQNDAELLKAIRRKAVLGRLLSFASLGRWIALWDDWNSVCKNNESKFITVPVGRKHYFGELHPRSVYFPAQVGSFEGVSVRIPNDEDAYLIKLYGPNYMDEPPVEQRETHAVYELDLGEQQ